MGNKVLVIDADPGIGDAVAIAAALFDPHLDVVGLTAVGGCVSGVQAGRNLQALVEALDPPKWPRIGTSETPACRPPDTEALPLALVNGPHGLGDWEPGTAELHHPRDATKLLSELSRVHQHELVVLTLGPLTNIALTMERDPGFLDRLLGLYCLGGAVDVAGDVTPVAEFNIYASPASARAVLKSPAAKTLIPLDVTRKTSMTFEQLDRLTQDSDHAVPRALRSWLSFSLREHHQHRGMECLWLPELTALAAISQPQLFQRANMGVDVELDGQLTRGMTVCDRRARPAWRPNLEILRDVDSQGLLDYLGTVLRQV
ncbi:MAG: nucleoside hydrolase [Planctomycetaceae bacterium]